MPLTIIVVALCATQADASCAENSALDVRNWGICWRGTDARLFKRVRHWPSAQRSLPTARGVVDDADLVPSRISMTFSPRKLLQERANRFGTGKNPRFVHFDGSAVRPV